MTANKDKTRYEHGRKEKWVRKVKGGELKNWVTNDLKKAVTSKIVAVDVFCKGFLNKESEVDPNCTAQLHFFYQIEKENLFCTYFFVRKRLKSFSFGIISVVFQSFYLNSS